MTSPGRFPVAAAALAAFFASACAKQTAPSPFTAGEGGRQAREIRIEVVNNNFADMTIYVMESGSNFRLGDVTGKTTGRFTLDPNQISPSGGLRLLADPIGSRDAFLSDPVSAGPGSFVVFTIGAALSQSYVTLR
ncbi:MAG: hypothetical protein ACWGSQ_16410 [Longimicrobiales bacterium]